MTFYQKLLIVTALATALGLLAQRSGPAGGNRQSKISTSTSLTIVASALIVVGIVSGTLIRHIIQIAPLLVALALLLRRQPIGAAAAAPLFAFWLLTMGAIWLFLLGLARIFTGRFTPTEVVLTIVIGAASALGLASTYHGSSRLSVATRLVTTITFGLLQYAAMWASVQPYVARR